MVTFMRSPYFNSKMQKLYAIGLFLVCLSPVVLCEDDEGSRDQKLISTFQIVRFPNDPCVGSNSRNGTCYTSQECSDKSGTSSGSCADGFGVCCTFKIDTCGKTTSENLTAWTQPSTVESGSCSLTVCPIDDSICSIRLDFTNFVITGPSTLTSLIIRRKFGQPTQDVKDDYALLGSAQTGSCLYDTFYSKSRSPSTGPPVLCGTATGEHMYLEADVDNCNHLHFHLADLAEATASIANPHGLKALATRTWDITITQIECTSKVNPPIGCTKYFWNAAGVATLKTSNWQVSTTQNHLAMQHDRYCIRRERGMCVGCFAAITDSGFGISGRSGNAAVAVNYVVPAGCCGYSTMAQTEDIDVTGNNLLDGVGKGTALATPWYDRALTQWGWDCIIIPGAYAITTNAWATIPAATTANFQQVLAASPTAAINPIPSGPQICGNSKGIGNGAIIMSTSQIYDQAKARLMGLGEANAMTICTRQTPFMLEFMSDDIEGLGGGTTAGFSEQMSTNNVAGVGFHIHHAQLAC